MNLFKSIFSGDGEESGDPKIDEQPQIHDGVDLSPATTPTTSATRTAVASWNFTGLVQTLAAKSESVIQTYRRDLEEFRSGIIAETAAIRAAVKDLPEAGASAAHASLESVGQAIDDIGSSVWREIVSHGGGGGGAGYFSDAESGGGGGVGQKIGQRLSYTRFDTSMRAIQSDVDTYCEDPEDDEFLEWKLGFEMEEGEKEKLLVENRAVEEIYRKLVPGVTDEKMFWCRYFFKVNKLKQAEAARVTIVKKALSVEDEELPWDLDEDEEESGTKVDLDSSVLNISESEKNGNLRRTEIDEDVHIHDSEPSTVREVEAGEGSSNRVVEESSSVGGVCVPSLIKVEEEAEWDEVEDVQKKDTTLVQEDEEEEDLSWDIEDDEDVKSL